MAGKFFDKNGRKSCAWCVHGIKSEYNDDIFCQKLGIITFDNICKKYKYNPLKRTPQKAGIADDYSPEDFKL